MGNLTYDKFVRSFDTYTEYEECICEKALNILQECKISKKYKLILPLYRRFSISKNTILLQDYIEDPLWLYDATDQDLMDRVRIHTRLKKGITDAYCKSHLGASVLIMESGRLPNSISISIESDECYKMALTTCNSKSQKLAPAIDDGLKVSNKLKILQDITLDKVVVLNQSSLSINDTEFYNGIKAHFPLVENGRLVVYYFFPNNIQTKTKKRYGYGGIFVVSEHFLSKDEKSFFLNVAFLLGNRLAIKSFQQKIKTESIKSAKAAIMSRNMSHNLGSHVMFYIKQKLQSVSKIVNNNVLHNIIPGNSEDINIKTITDKIAANKDVELPFLVGLGRFINYLQERQDYIATVATNYIPARSTISFKDFIYDELKPDLRYERHKKDNSSSDNGWQPKNLLLDYIAYSEGYSKSDAIEIKFGEFDGHDPLDDTAKGDFQALRKFNVAVPGGVIGRQAIFSIVENIIRNAAKHSEHRSNGKLVLQLSLVDAEKDFAAGRFEPDKFRCMRKEKGSIESGESLVKLYQNHKDTFHILRIKLDMPNKEEDIDAVVKKLGEDYVEEDGSMKETSKGLKEMRISAAWLRGHSIDTDIPTTEPPVLAVYSEPYDDTDKETISYYLCIPKPCKVAFVVDKELLTYIDDNGKESSYIDLNPMLEPFGCAVFGYDDETKQLNKKEQNNKSQGKKNKYQISDIADYEIVCMLLDDDNDKKRDSIVPYISSRYITNRATTKSILDELKGIAKPSKGSNQEGKNNERQYAQIKTAIDSIYEKWLETAYPKAKNTKLVIAEKKNDDSSKKENSVLESDKNVMRTTTGNVTDEDCKDSVVYSTHFKGLAPDGNYEKMLSNAACIEAITGNNSTDRLIRQDEWTKEWKSKHLSAGLAKVAIFDERIFSTFITKEQGKTKGQGIEEKIKEIKDQQLERGEQMQKIIAAIKQITNIEIDQEKAQKLLRDPDKVHQEIPSNSLAAIPNNFIWEHKTAQKNHERRIWAFDIRVEEKGKDKSVDIVGYNVSIENRVNTYIDHKTDAEVVIGNIEPTNNGGYTVKLKDANSLKSGNSDVFDYISIHQGILDKIYGAFGIKENDAAKLEVTKAIHSCFSKHDTPDDAKDFLPRFIIHSGRSKPNEKDMPQHQPFVQFAAIDHAVKDCKYTLVELLATAHYESNNNN